MSQSSPGMDKHPPILTQNSTKRSKRPQSWCMCQYKVAIHGPAARAHLHIWFPGEITPRAPGKMGRSCPSSQGKFSLGHYAKWPIGKAVKIVTILTIINRFLSA